MQAAEARALFSALFSGAVVHARGLRSIFIGQRVDIRSLHHLSEHVGFALRTAVTPGMFN